MKRIQLGILCLVAGIVSLWGSFRAVGNDDDFVGFYAAGKLAGSGHLFDVGQIARVEAAYQRRPHPLPFIRIPIYALLWKPLTWFPFQAARVLWMLLNLAAMIAATLLWPTRNQWAKAFVLCSYPFLYNLILGQDTALYLLFAVVACRLLEKGRDGVAGLLIACCAIKFNLALLFPVALIARRRWTAVGGAAAGLLALAALSSIEGIDWPVREFQSIQSVNVGQNAMPNFRGLAFWFPHSRVIEIALGLGLTVLVWWIARRTANLPNAIAAALAGGLLISHHAYLYDAVVLMPLLLLALETSGLGRAMAAIEVSPLFYLLPVADYLSTVVWLESQLLIVGFTIALLFGLR